jgi:hypothetical protein
MFGKLGTGSKEGISASIPLYIGRLKIRLFLANLKLLEKELGKKL